MFKGYLVTLDAEYCAKQGALNILSLRPTVYNSQLFQHQLLSDGFLSSCFLAASIPATSQHFIKALKIIDAELYAKQHNF